MLACLALSALVQGSQWTKLFDGSLDGWTKRGGAAEYRLDHGELVGTTAPNTPNTFLCSNRDYGDFELEYEVKVDPDLNSGVQIRSHSVSGYRDGVVFGYQVEIDPSDRAYSGGLYDESRSDWIQDLSNNEPGRKAFKNGKWNKYRVLARADHIQVWVNGVQTCDVRDGRDRFGFLGFQVHGVGDNAKKMEVRWRNVRVRDLGVPGATPPKGATVLMNGAADLAKWQKADSKGEPVEWVWKDGYMECKPGSGSIQTRTPYGACKLHVEFMVDENHQEGQANGNSGVYLQGSYEVQILNSAGIPPANNICGAIYSIKAEDINMAYAPYTWQTYDIMFTSPVFKDGKKVSNAKISVWHNGVQVHKGVEIPRQTGSGQPEDPTARGIYLQDHGHPIRFRNIWVIPM